MKAAFIIDVKDEAELDAVRELVKEKTGAAVQVVSSFGIALGGEEAVEQDVVEMPEPRPRRGRKAEVHESVVYVSSLEVERRLDTGPQDGRRLVRDNGRLSISIECEAEGEDMKVLNILSRARASGMLGLRNVER